jgi:hypothetical protein
MNIHHVGVDYCLTHHGIRNEDEHVCDFADDGLDPVDGEDEPECDLRELVWVEETS